MNKLILLACCTLLFCQCSDNGVSKVPADQSEVKTINLNITPANKDDYQKLIAMGLDLSPVGRLCAESKGYKVDDWDALNECSWAVEKHQLEKYADLVARTDNNLQIKTTDNVLILTHERTAPSTYYQFIDYLPNSKHFVVKIFQQSNCPKYWLIRAPDGQKTILPGRPVFTSNKDNFLLSTSQGTASKKCPRAIALWSLKDGVFQEQISQETKEVIHDLFWKKGMQWLGKNGEEVIQIEL